LQQHAALERFGIAHGGDLDVQARAGLDEGGDIGGDHDHGDVLCGEGGGGNGDAIALEHVGDGLFGINGSLSPSPARPATRPKPTSVVARAGHHDEIAQADAAGGNAEGGQEQDAQGGAGAVESFLQAGFQMARHDWHGSEWIEFIPDSIEPALVVASVIVPLEMIWMLASAML